MAAHLVLPSAHTQPPAAHLVPLVSQLIHGDGAVGVAGANPDAVALDHLLHLILDGQDGLPLPISLRQRSLELLVCGDQTLGQGTGQRTNMTGVSPVHSFIFRQGFM